jgi:hypothetical protein
MKRMHLRLEVNDVAQAVRLYSTALEALASTRSAKCCAPAGVA